MRDNVSRWKYGKTKKQRAFLYKSYAREEYQKNHVIVLVTTGFTLSISPEFAVHLRVPLMMKDKRA